MSRVIRLRSEELTRRQLVVMRLVADGESTVEIAASLGVSVHTVRTHVMDASRRLHARNRVHAVAMLLREGAL